MTTTTEFSKNPAITIKKQKDKAEKTTNYTELIRALTPVAIAMFGCIIGLSAILSDSIGSDSNKLTAAMGLAGTAIAGASGLAQSNKKDE